jgi:hypothetical protein
MLAYSHSHCDYLAYRHCLSCAMATSTTVRGMGFDLAWTCMGQTRRSQHPLCHQLHLISDSGPYATRAAAVHRFQHGFRAAGWPQELRDHTSNTAATGPLGTANGERAGGAAR